MYVKKKSIMKDKQPCICKHNEHDMNILFAGSQITSALYGNYAMVGFLPGSGDSSRMQPYAAVIEYNQSTSEWSIVSNLHFDGIFN